MAVKTYGRLAYEDGHFGIAAQPHVMIRLKRIFPRVQASRTGVLTVRDTPEVARDLEWALSRWPLEMDDVAARRLTSRADAHRASEEAVVHILAGGQATISGPRIPARAPRDYQTQAADLALTTGRLLLADDVGLGKSMSGLLLLRDPATLPALVVTLTHLPTQWMSELRKTFPDLLGHATANGDVYDPADRHGGRQPDVIITSYSKLAKWQHHLAGQVRTVIFDEVQELRRADSEKYRAAANIARKADYRVGLTATPVYNYAGEIHNVLGVLAPDALGSREEFLREWSGVETGRGNVSVRDASALGTYLRDQGIMLRRTRKDVGRELTEPVPVEQPIPTNHQTLDDAARDTADLARLILSDTSDRTARWQAAGDLDWKMRHATGVAKARYVADFVRMLLETEDKVVLYGWHRDVYDIWLDRLHWYHPRLYTGSESPSAKQAAVDAFTKGQSRVLIVSLRSGAGLDGLQEAAHVAVFGELDWSPGIHEQCIGRLWRDGQDETVIAYYLVSDGGTDPLMTEVLGLKTREAGALRGDQSLFNAGANTGDRVKRLAETILNRSEAAS